MKRVVIVGMALLLTACGGQVKDESVATPRDFIYMDVDEVYNKASENPFAFESDIAEKSIKLIGNVESIAQSPADGQPMISFKYIDFDQKYKGAIRKPNVFAIVEDKQEAATIVKGESIILLCNEVSLSSLASYNAVRLSECKIDTQQKKPTE